MTDRAASAQRGASPPRRDARPYAARDRAKNRAAIQRSDRQDRDVGTRRPRLLREPHRQGGGIRSEEQTSELQSLRRTWNAVFSLNKKKKTKLKHINNNTTQ